MNKLPSINTEIHGPKITSDQLAALRLRLGASKIEWTDFTYNPWIGCTRVSEACGNCYAELMARYRNWAAWGLGKPRQKTKTVGQVLLYQREAAKAGVYFRVFCASLADIFDEEVPPEWREEVWDLIRQSPNLIWLLLTKRPENFARFLPSDWGDGFPNVCLMTTVELSKYLHRVDILAQTPARWRGLSMEPLLGPVTLKPNHLAGIDWVITGGESGGNARPSNPAWFRSLRDQVQGAGRKFFFKQWGMYAPAAETVGGNGAAYLPGRELPVILRDLPGPELHRIGATPGVELLARAGKGENGRTLDGCLYLEHPFPLVFPNR